MYVCIIYLWLHWVFIAANRLSLAAASKSYSSCSAQASHCGEGVGFSWHRAQALGCSGFSSLVHELSCPMIYGNFPDQELNPCPQHWQADS